MWTRLQSSLSRVAWLAFAAGLLAGTSGLAQTRLFNTSQFTSVHSRSGQFTVTALTAPAVAAPSPRALKPSPDTIALEPAQTAIICERVKESLASELGATDPWRDKILVTLRPDGQGDSQVYLKTLRYLDGWQYRIEMPGRVETNSLVRAVVQTLLQEMANRHAGDRSVEVPLWLTEGLAAQLLATKAHLILLEMNTGFSLTARLPDALRGPRERFRQGGALAFSDLNLPAEQHLRGAGWDNYRASAHVFVVSLLQLNNGRAAMREMLRLLPSYLNSQFAFLRAFNTHFKSPLEVEKWWSLTLVNFSGRDQHLRWSTADVLRRLDEILRAPVEVHAASNALPRRAELPLQEAFFRLDFPSQKNLLNERIQQLQVLHWSAPPDLSKLISDYRIALATYLQRRDKAGIESLKGRAVESIPLLIKDTCRQLDLLDVIRSDLRQAANAPPASP